MKKIITIAAIFLCLSWTEAFAETSIKAQLNKTVITTDELLTYRLTITSFEKQLPKPKIPKFDGFKVVSSSESSNISFIKNKIRTVITYGFILAPTETGKFKIEPSSIKIRNQAYSTAAFEIEVRQGRFKPKIKPKEKPPLPEETLPESEVPRTTL